MKNLIINQIVKKIILLIFLILVLQKAFAYHRAGQITYEHIGENMYRIQLIVYSYSLSPASKPEIEIRFGDGTSEMVDRTTEEYFPNDYIRNTYVVEHKYAGPGTFVISVVDPRRMRGIRNIPNSTNNTFALKTILQINASLGANSSPYFENPLIEVALIDSIFTYNSNATDPDDDSLSYKLTECLGENAEPIDDYQYPEASISFGIDPISGDLIWNKPIYLGFYSVAVEIEEWRAGIKIGSTIREMQIEVVDKLTGMADISKCEIKIYPNPTSDILHFDFADNEIKHIKVLNLSGKVILEKTSVKRNETLNLSGFPAGMYFILIQTDKETLVKKIIKE